MNNIIAYNNIVKNFHVKNYIIIKHVHFQNII